VQNTGRGTFALGADRDQQVLGANILILQARGFFFGALYQALGTRRHIHLIAVSILPIHFGTLFQLALDALGHGLAVDIQLFKRPAGQAIALTEHRKEDVLDVELGVMLLLHYFLGFLKRLVSLLCEPFQTHVLFLA
jgi:hypothetical protein